ncbi:MAG: cobalt-precorrin-5B (C(1))-methyltransferase CbiD [Lachnospiraceae bacterium]|nr:cobalt-precorrin-5B (C(1))-methyltransferase CbiD [Lachnospiraceae bacterium]
MKIDLIRHGCTAGNLEHRYVGSTDEPLTGEAIRQLERNRAQYAQPDIVFASPLRRCVQTAELLFPDADIRLVPDLRECEFGEFEYKNYEELNGDPRYQSWIDSGGMLAFPGGESRETFSARCCGAFLRCMETVFSSFPLKKDESLACMGGSPDWDRTPANSAEGKQEEQNKQDKQDKQEGAHEEMRAAFVVHGGTIMAILDRFAAPHRDYFEWQVKNAEGFSGDLFSAQTGDRTEESMACLKKLSDSEGKKNPFYIMNIRPLPSAPALTGIEEQFVMKKNKKLRCGYTTGSCAAAAAKAAVWMLLTGRSCYRTDLMTPKGIRLHLPVEEQKISANSASCAVRKYAGDDPDATDGVLVFARAEFAEGPVYSGEAAQALDFVFSRVPDRKSFSDMEEEISSVNDVPVPVIDSTSGIMTANRKGPRIYIEGGIGVGRVTKPGLEQPVGAAAINRVPREMITREVASVCEECEYSGSIKITISVPEGVEIAKRTFNPHLGIQGGISILGTSGIVVPMSEDALIASIRVEMKQKVAQGEQYILITPGNYGADFIRRGAPDSDAGGAESLRCLNADDSMKCSNYVGETLDIAEELGVKGILFVAHIGKFIKVSGGIMNTHSAHADCRAELMAAQAARAGAPFEIVRKLLDTNTTEEAVGILKDAGWLEPTMAEVANQVKFHLQKHCRGALKTEAILFSNQYGYLGETDGADAMAKELRAMS